MIRAQSQLAGDKHIPFLRYYGIKVFYSEIDRQKLDSNKSLARLIIFLGLCLIIISAIDISRLSSTLTQSEQSIWPSNGKGLWIGLFIMCIGIFTYLAVKEETHSAFYILLPYIIVGIILCFFGLLTSISVLQRYTKDPNLSQQTNRNQQQTIQFALNALFIGLFTLAFLFLSCLSCIICWTIPKFCDKSQTSYYNQFYPPSFITNQGAPMNFPLQVPINRHQRYNIRNSPNKIYQYAL